MRPESLNLVFLGALLDFLTMNDEWIIEFCDTVNLSYEQLMNARMLLPGGEQMHWT